MKLSLLPIICGLFVNSLVATTLGGEDQTEPFAVQIRVDADKPLDAMRPVWRYFGYDEPNFTYMKDGKKLLTELSQLGSTQVYIRTHHLLTTGDGSPALKWGSTNAYTEDAEGRPVYTWTIIDRIFDTYLERGLKPLVQIGFMPEALSVHSQDYPRNPPFNQMAPFNAGQAYPPKDYGKWGELCFQWAQHCVEKYGIAEVEQWPWEVWNEPNIEYWRGRPEDYHKLYDFAVAGVRRAIPNARVGGPHTSGGPGGTFLKDFLEHCLHGVNYVTGENGSPLDFVAFHAKGTPKFENGHVQMGLSAQLRNIDAGFATVASFPELKQIPIIIGESDPEGCAACQGPQLGYRNGTMYSSYTAASFARKFALARKHKVNFEGALTWAFEFENQPYFAGFRVLASNGIDLPVLNVFRMFGKMSGQSLHVTSTSDAGLESILTKGVRERADVSAMASLDKNRLCIVAWHYHDQDVAGSTAAVEFTINGLPTAARNFKMRHFRIDSEHSNAFETWKRMGSPTAPTPEEYKSLQAAGQLAELHSPPAVTVKGEAQQFSLILPRQSVSLFVLEW